MKGNIIQMNTLHLNSVRLNGIGKVQSVSLKGGSTEDPVFPPVEPPIEPEPTPTYTLSASVTNGKVSATRNGSAVNLPFTANEGDTIVLEVTPNDGYEFNGWADGNTDNPRSITMNADVALSAQCVEVVAPPVGNYIQFEDAEVERVLMSKGVSSDGVGITIEDAEKVTSISTWFKGNTAITSFEEFEHFTGVTSTDTNAFLDSTIASIAFPDSLTTIGNATFARCSNLAIDVNLPQVTTIDKGAFLKTAIKSVYAPNLVNLYGANNLGAFGSCGSLERADIGKVTVIPIQCFSQCSKLREVVADWDNVTSIEGNAFLQCASLPNFEIGSKVTSIGAGAFNGCTSMQTFICRSTTPPTLANANAFGNNSCVFYVPDASLEAYKTAVNWSAYADRIHPLSEIEGAIIITQKNVTDADIVAFTEGGGRGEIIYPVSDFSSYNIMLSVAEGSPLKACVHLKRSPNWNDNRRDSGWMTAGQSYETDDSADEGRQCPYIGIGCTYAASGKGVPTAEEIKQYLTFQIEMIY